jgi:hypothetical protein
MYTEVASGTIHSAGHGDIDPCLALLRANAAASFRLRSAQICSARPASLSAGVT